MTLHQVCKQEMNRNTIGDLVEQRLIRIAQYEHILQKPFTFQME